MKNLNVAIIGIGGVGGYIAGKLIKNSSGQLNSYLIARGEHLTAIQDNGLKIIENESTEFTVKPTDALEDISKLKDIDLFIIAVKSYDLNEICQAIKPKVKDDTIILPLLNGFDIAQKIKNIINKGHVLPGLIYVSSKINEPGVIKLVSDSHNIIFGKDNPGSDYYPKKLISLFDQAEINYQWSDDPAPEIWKKYIFISSFSLVTSLNNKTIGEILEDDSLKTLTADIMQEILQVAQAYEVELDDNIVTRSLNKATEFPYDTMTSLQRDIAKGKEKNELDIFAESIIKAATKYGVSVPNIQRVYKELNKKE